MSRLLKSRGYFMKSLGFVLLFGFISLGAIGGCSDNNGGGQDSTGATTALTENDLVNDPSLRADLERHLIVHFLEHPETLELGKDTGEVGIDEIPVTYQETVEQRFCWEDDDTDAMHFMELVDSEGSEILRVDVNGECVTEVIEAGDYVLTLHHDGRILTTHPIFMIPNPDDTQQSRETDGLINRFKLVIVNILQGIHDTVSKDARASIQDNIDTLLKTNYCLSCNLGSADLTGAVLNGAQLYDADLARAKLGGAKLSGAVLEIADLSYAVLTGADLRYANLNKATLTGAVLTGAELLNATWCNGCICDSPSKGTCVGCPSVEEVCN
ncbi:MAG: pentapeptide repeat-containing protein [Thermodesulfobacteriales bacterium]|nr:MAG: pentapeptide repeat-containing protein [Thermodesulfobacteriales bacterium]